MAHVEAMPGIGNAVRWIEATPATPPALVALAVLALAAPEVPQSAGFGVQAAWLLVVPLGILFGAYIYATVLEPRGTPDTTDRAL